MKRSGSYNNASDYFRSLIRSDLESLGEDRLEVLLVEGFASGEPEPISRLLKRQPDGYSTPLTSGCRPHFGILAYMISACILSVASSAIETSAHEP